MYIERRVRTFVYMCREREGERENGPVERERHEEMFLEREKVLDWRREKEEIGTLVLVVFLAALCVCLRPPLELQSFSERERERTNEKKRKKTTVDFVFSLLGFNFLE